MTTTIEALKISQLCIDLCACGCGRMAQAAIQKGTACGRRAPELAGLRYNRFCACDEHGYYDHNSYNAMFERIRERHGLKIDRCAACERLTAACVYCRHAAAQKRDGREDRTKSFVDQPEEDTSHFGWEAYSTPSWEGP